MMSVQLQAKNPEMSETNNARDENRHQIRDWLNSGDYNLF